MEALEAVLRCGAFRIDLDDERLWYGAEAIALRPKTWAVLRLLIERPGRLVTKGELIEAVWRGTVIEEKVLNASIAEIRRALRDDARAPRYVETVPRRGFRFVAPVDAAHDAPVVRDRAG
ncbi:winged helix-turn-helix domain-containing protein, partial [Candidatus Binatia bacterium]|nr:winged helix-turn-helix domain-containing protein [Candidatus Binatia bacterium]